jgi:hypothetical protein
MADPRIIEGLLGNGRMIGADRGFRPEPLGLFAQANCAPQAWRFA